MALTTPRLKAAALVAEGSKTLDQIAAELGIPRRTLARWTVQAEFVDRVEQIAAKAAATLTARGITEKANRLRDYEELRAGLLQIKRERAEAGEALRQPGAGAGLLVRGEFGYVTDQALVSGLLAVNKQASQELGQWVEKRQSDDRITVEAGDALGAIERRLSRLADAGGPPRGALGPDAGAGGAAALPVALLGATEPAPA